MARLNTTSPVKQDAPKSVRKLNNRNGLFLGKFTDGPAAPQWDEEAFTILKESPKTTATARNDKPVQRKRQLKRSDTASTRSFNIFSDSDGLSDREDDSFTSRSSTEGRTSDPLKLARTNSLLMPQSRHSRSRSTRKSELYDYTKENYPEEVAEDYSTTSISRNPSDASTARTPMRRLGRQTPGRNKRDNRLFSSYRQTYKSEDESEDDGFNSLDDFIVSDNEEPSYHHSSEAEPGNDEAIKAPTPPRRKKRLVKGRRPNPEAEVKKALESSAYNNLRLEPTLPAAISMASPEPQPGPKRLFKTPANIDEKLNRLALEDEVVNEDGLGNENDDQTGNENEDDDAEEEYDPSSQLQQDLDNFLGRDESPRLGSDAEQEDSADQRPVAEPVNLATPPASPSPTKLRSPTKSKIRIPPTPFRESSDAFWCQETNVDWIEQHSPRKALEEFAESDHEADVDLMPRNREAQKAPKSPSKTALKKAEIAKKKAALAEKKSFDDRKAAIAEDFFKVLDDLVTDGEIQKLTEETGGLAIIWSKTLQTTAGRANWKRERTRTQDGQTSPSKHRASIELAERVIDDEHRLLNTLAHEYCHLTNYMISNVHNNPHGPSFKQWGLKCKEALRDHPVYGGRVEVTTKHSYKIDYKYVWSCVDCGQTYGRHSKSIDPTKSRCGKCKGLLQQIKPKPRSVSPRKKQDTETVEHVTRVLGQVSL
ncbi:SprT-like family-domain-containing protein [Aspergillus avenaceus]|uniref:SprT-like family-domain-containing protein n=1 Tax=Aspergillus avenaceus TaxID=36643 RepID=A0A5N6TML7_ASPAV|nr:SprT-like family-domain-containing protein [Aspergillus avenaceus]